MCLCIYHTHREQDSGTPFCIDMKGQSAVIYKVRLIYRGNRLVLPARYLVNAVLNLGLYSDYNHGALATKITQHSTSADSVSELSCEDPTGLPLSSVVTC